MFFKQMESVMKTCLSCGNVIPKKSRICPNCEAICPYQISLFKIGFIVSLLNSLGGLVLGQSFPLAFGSFAFWGTITSALVGIFRLGFPRGPRKNVVKDFIKAWALFYLIKFVVLGAILAYNYFTSINPDTGYPWFVVTNTPSYSPTVITQPRKTPLIQSTSRPFPTPRLISFPTSTSTVTPMWQYQPTCDWILKPQKDGSEISVWKCR